MKTLTTFLIIALSFSHCVEGAKALAQDALGDEARVESEQLEATISQLREQLLKLERDRASVSVNSDAAVEPSSVNLTRSGNGAFDNSQAVDMVPAILPDEDSSTFWDQQVVPYQQALPMSTTLPSSSLFSEQPLVTPTIPSVLSDAITTNVQPVYEEPVSEWAQPAPVVQQRLVAPQTPAAQTIIVNVYQQSPAAQRNYFPPILAPIYGPAPIQVVAPRRGCCLFGRR